MDKWTDIDVKLLRLKIASKIYMVSKIWRKQEQSNKMEGVHCSISLAPSSELRPKLLQGGAFWTLLYTFRLNETVSSRKALLANIQSSCFCFLHISKAN